jgi:hypothetical protein
LINRRALARALSADSGKFGELDVSTVAAEDGKQNDVDYW